MSRLPADLEANILLRLPTKSLLRCKCVCKLWRDLINETSFRNRHMEKSNNKKHFIFRNSRDCVYIWDFEKQKNPRKLNFPFTNWKQLGLNLVGSSHGLLCFLFRHKISSNNITFFYNPTTQTFKTLPRPPLPPDLPNSGTILVFGYDSLSDDYKCATIELSSSSKSMVYSMKRDDWKPAAMVVNNNNNNNNNKLKRQFIYPVVVGGVVHWGFEYDLVNYEYIGSHILGFDLNKEAQTLIPVPVNVKLMGSVRFEIGTADSCLFLIYHHYNNNENYNYSTQMDRYDVWMMKEYGVANSWKLVCRVQQPNKMRAVMRPFSLLKTTINDDDDDDDDDDDYDDGDDDDGDDDDDDDDNDDDELLLVEYSNDEISEGVLAALNLETNKIVPLDLPPGFAKLEGLFECLENLLALDDSHRIPWPFRTRVSRYLPEAN